MEEWQHKRGTPEGGQRLTTAFLDGTHPVVDVYELKASAREGQGRVGRAGLAGQGWQGEVFAGWSMEQQRPVAIQRRRWLAALFPLRAT